MVIIGIDPGQHCGLAVLVDGEFETLHTVQPHELIAWLFPYVDEKPEYEKPVIVFEDSRLQSYVWNAAGKSRAEGALRIARNLGQVDAICSMIHGWAGKHWLPYVQISPRDKGGKIDAKGFERLTGYKGRSNQHERDAGVLAWRFRGMSRKGIYALMMMQKK